MNKTNEPQQSFNRHSLRAFRSYLGLDRNVSILAASTFGLGLGEELWQAYLPKYLVALGGSSLVVGLFASCRDLLDGLYQYPGGWINDRFGRKRTLMLFTLVAMSGYAVYAMAPHWPLLFLGLVLAMGWKSGAFPATFAVIGDALPQGQRAIAFSVQSMLVRVPRVIGAPVGGMLIVGLGLIAGIRVALGVTLVLAFAVLVSQQIVYRESGDARPEFTSVSARELLRTMSPHLKRLLLAECFVRTGEAISLAFIVLYVTDILQYPASTYGILYAIQQTVAVVMYLPSGKLADLAGRKPIIAVTFFFFAFFPLAVFLSGSFSLLVLAFIAGGLKEFGEPARKSFIVDLSPAAQRGRMVGIYYTIRNLLIVPAGTIGGLLWQHSPALTLTVSCGVGLVGMILFLLTSRSKSGLA